MNIDPFIESRNFTAANSWRDQIAKIKPETKDHDYIAIDSQSKEYQSIKLSSFGENTQKVSIANIVQISQNKFTALKKTLEEHSSKQKYLTEEEIDNFSRISNAIAYHTEKLITAREKKGTPSKVMRVIAPILFILSLGLIDLQKEHEKFDQEISTLRKGTDDIRQGIKDAQIKKRLFDYTLLTRDIGVSSEIANQILDLKNDDTMIQLIEKIHRLKAQTSELKEKFQNLSNPLAESINELKFYIDSIQKNIKDFGLNIDQAASYAHLTQSINKTTIPFINSDDYKNQIQHSISSIFSNQLTDYYSILPKKKPALMGQFEKDIPRGNTFKRKDTFRKIDDPTPIPPLGAKKKLSDASKAIMDLIVDPEEEGPWINILQLAVSQTSLNATFMKPKIDLAQLAVNVTWTEETKEYVLTAEFSEGKPPPTLIEMIRNDNGIIEKVNVSIEGSLDLVKKETTSSDEIENETLSEKASQSFCIKGAIQSKLNYTITLDKSKNPIISDVKCFSETNIAPENINQQ